MAKSIPQSVIDAYRSGRMAPVDRADMEAAIASGEYTMSAEPGARAKPAAKPIPQSVIDAYRSGKMAPADRAEMEAAIARGEYTMDLQASFSPAAAAPGGVQLSGDASPYNPEAPEPGVLPEFLTPMRFSENRIQEYEDLPDLIRAPAVRSLSGAVAMFTNTGADEVEKIIKANNPGTEVETRNGYKVYKFPGDDQRYAWKPGVRLSDVARAVPGALVGLGAAAAAVPTLPAAIGTGISTAVAGELAQLFAGGTADILPVAVSGAAPLAVPAAKGAANKVAQLGEYLTAPIEQTVEGVAPQIASRARELAVLWGADPDLPDIARRLANLTEPAVEQAETNLASATASKEAATRIAAARAESGALRATTTAEETALAAKTRAEDAASAVSARLEGATKAAQAKAEEAAAVAAAKAESVKVAAAIPVNTTLDQARKMVEAWGAGDISVLDARARAFIRGAVKDAMDRADTIYKKIEAGLPKAAGIPASAQPEFDAALAWLNTAVEGQSAKMQSQSPLLTLARETLAESSTIADIIALRKRAQAVAGSKILTDAAEDKGAATALADKLTDLEHSIARHYGMESLVEAGKREVSTRKTYEEAVRTTLGAKSARALKASIIPKIETSAVAMRKGITRPLQDLMNVAKGLTGEGMEGDVMAAAVQKAMLDSAPDDPGKALQHIVGFVEDLKAHKEVSNLVFSKLPASARDKLLGAAADASAALERRAAAEMAAESERAAAVLAAKGEREAAERAARHGAAAEKLDIRRTKNAELSAAKRDKAAELARLSKEEAGVISAAKTGETAAKDALARAEAANINLATDIRKAGTALANGDIKPFKAMIEATPGLEQEVAASTWYHAMVNPADDLVTGLKRIAKVNGRLKASPTAMSELTRPLPSGAEQGIRDLADLSRIVSRASASGKKRVEGFVGALASVGAWAGWKSGAVFGAAVGTAVAGPGLGTAGGSAIGGLAGRMLTSFLSKGATAETRAANEWLASTAGKAILARLAMKPADQGMIQALGKAPAFQKLMRGLKVPESKWSSWIDQAVRTGSKMALSRNNTNNTIEE